MNSDFSESPSESRRIGPDDMWAVSESRMQQNTGSEPTTERYLAELRVLQSVMDSLNDALVVVDMAGNVVLSNPAARKMFGVGTDGMPFDAWRDRFMLLKSDRATSYGSEERPLVRGLQGERVDIESIYMIDRVTNMGRWVSMTIRPILDDQGAVQGAFGVFHDITRRKTVEERLMLRNRAMATAMEGIMIAEIAQGFRIVYANEGFERMTGYARPEILGRDLRFLEGPQTNRKTVRKVRLALAKGESCTVEVICHRKDGSAFWNRMSLTPVRDDEGQLTHFVGIHSDITKQKETEDRLRAARDELRDAYRRIKRNLDAAASVQQALLPSDLPPFSWGSVAWRFKPCDELAGDILSIFPLDDDHIGAYVLDVCGHGVAAALLSVTVRRFMSPSFTPASMVVEEEKGAPKRQIVPPSMVANELNKRFAWDANRGQFFTMVYGVLNTQTGEFRYVLAGHPPPFVVAEGRPAVVLRGSGFPVGLMDIPYREQSIRLSPGDRLVLYSDGVTDVMNPDGRLFGDERITQILADCTDLPIEKALDRLMEGIDEWRNGARLHDDISLVAIEFNPICENNTPRD